MYPPTQHLEYDLAKLHLLIKQYPFATIISQYQGEVEITQIPLILKKEHNGYVLYGHMDSNNPHINKIDKQKTQVIFHGPNGYISPNIYPSKQLPTWNSLSVHIIGQSQVFKDSEQIFSLLEDSTEQFESEVQKNEVQKKESPFLINRTEMKTAKLVHYISGIKIPIDSIVGRYKISRDKSKEDMLLAAEQLKQTAKLGADQFIDIIVK